MAMPDGKMVLLSFISIMFLLLAGWAIASLPLQMSLVVLGGIIVFFLTIINIEIGLMLLIFVIPLTRQLTLTELVGAPVDIGVDDMLLLCLIFGWLGNMARTKSVIFTRTPLNWPFLGMLFIGLVSLVPLAFKFGGANLLLSGLHLIKWFEYILIYFMVVSTITSLGQVRRYVYLFLGATAMVVVIQLFQMLTGRFAGTTWTPGGELRWAMATFESNGILGAYYVFFTALVVSFALDSKSLRGKLLLLVFSLAMSYCLFNTYSRAAYVGLIGSLIALSLLLRDKRVLAMVMIAIVLSVGFTATSALERAKMTVITVSPNITLEPSAAGRLYTWKQALKVFASSPLIGIGYWGGRYHGAFGFSTAHSQYLTILAETGILGFAIFCWLLVRMFKNSAYLYRTSEVPFLRSLSVGYSAGLIGVLIHGIFGETLTSFRMTGPLWFMTALVIVAQRFHQEGKDIQPKVLKDLCPIKLDEAGSLPHEQ